MWVDDDGVLHTVSLPDPSLIVGESAVRFTSGAGPLKRRQIRRMLEELEEDFLGQEIDSFALHSTDLPYPPSPVLGNISSIKELRTQLREVPTMWRLDAITTLDEILE